MAIVEIECPNCGGKVQRIEDKFFATCPYCGSEVCFNEIKEEVKLGKYRDQINELKKSSQEEEEQRKKLQKWVRNRNLVLTAIGVLNLIGFLIGAYASIRDNDGAMGFAVLFMITGWVIFMCSIPLVGLAYPGYNLLYGTSEKGGKWKMALKIAGMGVLIQLVTAFVGVLVMSILL
ncbi:MAG: IBR domain-containing protein [Lachnospiraceae bacterium]|nr:IBR domain-containing protein [Lachnospiraceae bacterium]